MAFQSDSFQNDAFQVSEVEFKTIQEFFVYSIITDLLSLDSSITQVLLNDSLTSTEYTWISDASTATEVYNSFISTEVIK
jgi:hypothetical protein